jgi:hypothetical protein
MPGLSWHLGETAGHRADKTSSRQKSKPSPMKRWRELGVRSRCVMQQTDRPHEPS